MLRFLTIIISFLVVNNAYAAEFFSSQQPEIIQFIDKMVEKHNFDHQELALLLESIKKRPPTVQQAATRANPKPWHIYRSIFVNPERITQGLTFWKTHQEALDKAEKIYGIPASIIVATIGVETHYGQQKGKFKVIDALVNLAFNPGNRAHYFRKELEEFLLLSHEQHFDPFRMMGSYAGAIGQPQFMPSSFRHYAVNFSNDGSIDLSNNETDVIGSIANYYHKNGWRKNQIIAKPMSSVGGEYSFSLIRPKPISLTELIKKQLTPQPDGTPDSRLLKLQTQYGSEYWLGFHNFDVIRRYNHSDLYAMAVYQLSYYLTLMRRT
ncbi:MAG: lytic murein transglycosylase B [Gammaproteobacteria bacterium]